MHQRAPRNSLLHVYLLVFVGGILPCVSKTLICSCLYQLIQSRGLKGGVVKSIVASIAAPASASVVAKTAAEA